MRTSSARPAVLDTMCDVLIDFYSLFCCVAVPSTMQLYFQQILPLTKCVAENGRLVGHLLLDLVKSKPKDLAHAIREFANRTAMLRECGFGHIGDMLVAMLEAGAHSDSEQAPPAAAHLAAQDAASVTAEQATAIGRMLATRTRSSLVPASELRELVDLHAIFRTMKKYAWFVPMLEVLLAPPESELRRPSIMRRLSAVVNPEATAHDVSNAIFDSVVRPIRAASQPRSAHRARRHTLNVGVWCRRQYRLL